MQDAKDWTLDGLWPKGRRIYIYIQYASRNPAALKQDPNLSATKRIGLESHATFHHFFIISGSPGVHFLIILAPKWRLETTWGPKRSHKASRSRKSEFSEEFGPNFVTLIFMFFRIRIHFVMFFCMFFSGVVPLPFSMDSWTPGRSEIMPKQCRVLQNQGFAFSGNVWFQTPFGVHFDVILEGLGHQSFTFSGFLGGLLFVPKTLKFGRPTVSRGRSKRGAWQYYFKRSFFYFSIRIEASG